MKNYFLTILSCLCIISCRKEKEETYYPIDEKINLTIPAYFPEIKYNLKDNYPTKYGVELGRKLFYDGRLSKDNTISCGFCHIQENGFTHHGHRVSHGVEGREGFRNSLPIQNLIFLNSYMWDGSIEDLNRQPIAPIHSFSEMDENFASIINKIKNDEKYKRLFKIVYGDENITSGRILKSLAQFMVTMVSFNSKYDKVMRNEAGIKFSQEESEGFKIFKEKCISCHSTSLFTDQTYRDIGMTPDNSLKDDDGRTEEGRMRVTGNRSDYLKFRVPSLRNVEYTTPYGHDGRFRSLEAILDFFSSGVERTPNLDAELQKTPGKIGIPLTEKEKKYLIAFLKTLSDPDFISNPYFSPFYQTK